MTATTDVILEVQNLVKHFPVLGGSVFAKSVGVVRAVDDVTLQIPKGKVRCRAVLDEAGRRGRRLLPRSSTITTRLSAAGSASRPGR